MPTLRANGLELCYETFGDPADRPLVLIMGLATQMIFWPEEFCESLANAGHFVVRFDNRDVGRSTWMEDAGVPNVPRAVMSGFFGLPVVAPYSLDDMADDTIGLLDALGLPRAHVCGISMGGMIAQALAFRHPSRVLSLTSIMSSTGHRSRARPRLRAARMVLGRRPDTRDGYIQFQDRLWRTIGSPGFPFEADVIRARAERAWARGVTSAGAARQLVAIIASGNRTQALQAVRLPTLVVHGADDPLIPVRGGRDTAAAIPGARLRVFEGMGHDMPRALWPDLIALLSEHTRAGHPEGG